MYNKVIMMGRIVNDLELKTTPQGVSVLSFRIAVDRSYAAKGEERKSDFFNIVCWRSNAEFVSKYFSKGRLILIEGELQTRQYTDKNGNQSTWYEIIADRTSFTGEAKNQQGGTYSSAYANGAPSHPAETINSSPTASTGSINDFVDNTDSDDDYPF